MMQLLLAFQFLTIFPIRISRTVGDAQLAGSMRYYPLVGAFLGTLSAFLYWAALQLFSPMAAVVVSVVGLIVFSGALHLDGFADTCDAFYGHRDREKILAIMKDSHVGAMAVIGVFCLLALKIAFLTGLETTHAMAALILAPMMGRWSMVWLCVGSTYARPEGGTASAYIGRVDKTTLLIATLLCGGIAFLLWHLTGLIALSTVALASWLFRRYTDRRLGGLTGDTLGACNEVVEVFVLALLSFHGMVFQR